MFKYDSYDSIFCDVRQLVGSGKLKIASDLVILEPIDDKSDGMIEMPCKQTERDIKTTFCIGIIKAIGLGDYNKKGVFIHTLLKVGQKVLLARSHLMRQQIRDEFFYLTREKEILCVYEEESDDGISA